MFGERESFDTYKVTFESVDQARLFRDIISGFWSTIEDTENVNPNLKLSVQKLRLYLERDKEEREFDFDGLSVGYQDGALAPEKRYGWALDIHDIAVAVSCLSIDAEEPQELLQDLVGGINAIHSDPSLSLKADIGLNHGFYIQVTEEIEEHEITEDHINLALDRIYKGQGITDFDRERYKHPSHKISDPKIFVSSIVANVEVEGIGSTLSYVYDKLVELGMGEPTANRKIIIHELLRMASQGLDRPMIMLGASGIEETLLVECDRDPNDPDLTLEDAVKIAFSENRISKRVGYACSVVREVRNELGHSSWPSTDIDPETITLASSLVVLIFSELLDVASDQTPDRTNSDIDVILDELRSVYRWELEYEDGSFCRVE
jgi:RNA-binding protein YhbY